ncbi:MAG: hypothetical protein HOK72_12025 [Flavobacteriales bacterium]|nr:hypothetical protein [Flavobacteriales bacterium]
MTEKEEQKEQLGHLSEIRNLMEKSSRFLSLSGLTGIFAGVYALEGAYLVYSDFNIISSDTASVSYSEFIETANSGTDSVILKIQSLFTIGAIVLVLSLVTGYIFTSRKAKKQNLNVWDSTTKRMVVSLSIPLIAGGIFCLILIKHEVVGLIAPATLIFYGLALLNASKYTFNDIKYLGVLEIVLGLVSAYYIGSGLLFWAMGFGVLHIVYGAVMYFKYDQNK